MEPRLKTSKKSTDFPSDYIKLIKDVIGKNFKKYLKDKTIVAEGFIYPEEIVVRIGFKSKGAAAQRNFEASVDYSPKKKNVLDQINLAMDALGSVIDQYFKADEELDLPLTWEKFDLEGKSVYLRFTRLNPELEAQADEMLKKAGHDPADVSDPDDDDGSDTKIH
jgi:hypothetical protein